MWKSKNSFFILPIIFLNQLEIVEPTPSKEITVARSREDAPPNASSEE